MTDDYSPRYVGDLANPLTITLTDHQGVPYSLAGISLSADVRVTFIPAHGGQPIVGTGSWSFVTNGTDGKLLYEWSASDVAQAGLFAIRLAVRLSGRWLNFDTKLLELLDPTAAE